MKLGSRNRSRNRTRCLILSCERLEQRCLLAADLVGREFVEGEILVQFAPNATATQRSAALSAVGGQLAETIQTPTMKAVGWGMLERVQIGKGLPLEKVVETLERMPNVEFAEPNYIYRPSVVSNDTYYTNGSLWGMYGSDSPTSVGPSGTANQFGIDAERAWNDNVVGSSNILVGVIDEGIQVTHPDLVDNIWVNPFEIAGDGIDNDGNGYADDIYGWDFAANDNSVYDAGGDAHGTHVAGTIGGKGGNSSGVVGVNWNVKMISAKFLGTSGGTTANAVRAIDYLTDLKARHGINIVASNNSWGGGGYSQTLHDAIIRGAKKEILFIAAAGNSTSNNDAVASYPSNYNTTVGTSTQTAASYDGVIAVASITNTGAISSFSSYGATTVDIGAPGSGIWSTVPSNTYASYNGTSMATPHVTGAAALYASVVPAGTSAALIKSALLNTLTPTTSLSGKTVTGGRLNVYNAVKSASSIRMDKSVYGGSDTITVSVQSTAANLNSSGIETITAQMSSTTETTFELITLTETGANTALFVGTISVSTGTAVADGVLQVANADQISAYNVGLNQTAVATVDTVAPNITSLSSTPRSENVEIKWTTNEAATTEVLYGTSPTNLSNTYNDTSLLISHTAAIGGLAPSTIYYYQARSRDAVGNETLSAIARFATTSPAPILFVDDDQGASYERFYNAAFQANNYSYDTWNVASVGATPTAAQLDIYDIVVWNTGADFSSTGAGLSSTAEQTAIQGYLDAGGRIFISGQDVLYNGVTTTFRTNYLKVSAFTSDLSLSAHTESGVAGNAISYGQSLAVAAPSDFGSLYIDAVSPVAGAEGTYLHGLSTAAYPFSTINFRGNYATGGFGMVFSTLPFEAISSSATSPNNQATVMKRVVEYLNGVTVPGITVSAPTPSANTTEAGGAVSFNVVLDSQPIADVTIPVSTSNTNEGTVNKASLLFTSANWSTPQTVTVTGVDDSIDDGNIAYTVVLGAATSADAAYNGRNPADASLTNQDNDTAGVTVSPPSGTSTTEAGGQVTFTIKLDSQPTADVSIGITSNNTTEGTVSPSSLVFTAANWSTPQAVTVTGVNDNIYDGNISYVIQTGAAASSDALYNNRAVADVSLVNIDDDSPPPTKFFVVDDGTTDRTFEYTATGGAIKNSALNSDNTAPRGAAMISAGGKLWVVDNNRRVYVYSNSGVLQTSWTAGTLASNAIVQGIATDGTNIWIVDARSDRVFYYANAANTPNTGTIAATGNWVLGSGNTGPTDVVYGTDGTKRYLWVVNNATTDRVYRYVLNADNSIRTNTTGTDIMIYWALNTANKAPSGVTLDPSQTSGTLWVVDSGTDRIYEYANARGTTVGTLATSYALTTGNTNPQGIAGPPPSGSVSSAAVNSAATTAPGVRSPSVLAMLLVMQPEVVNSMTRLTVEAPNVIASRKTPAMHGVPRTAVPSNVRVNASLESLSLDQLRNRNQDVDSKFAEAVDSVLENYWDELLPVDFA